MADGCSLSSVLPTQPSNRNPDIRGSGTSSRARTSEPPLATMASVTLCGIATTNLTSKFSMGRSKSALKGAFPNRSRRLHHGILWNLRRES